MGLFSRKPSHRKYVESTYALAGLIFDRTYGPKSVVKLPKFERNDSPFRHLFFCLSTVHMVCASQMKNPDAVLNEAAHTLLTIALSEREKYFSGEVNPQEAANLSAECLNDFLHRWSTYIEIIEGGNNLAARNIISGMIWDVATVKPITDKDADSINDLASWFQNGLKDFQEAFQTILSQ
jgi:hypothetical protein